MKPQQHIIITGANGNLGTATVKRMLEEGHHVIAVDNSGNHLGFAHDNDNFELHAVDLANPGTSDFFITEMITKYEHIDVALLLAGGFSMGSIENTDANAIQEMIELNFYTAYNIVQPLFANMLQHNYGRLVFVGARPAINATDGYQKLAYALSKSLLFTLAENINAATMGKNISASVIVPSIIDTMPNRQSMPDANFNDWVKPEDIAEAMAFICSENASAIREGIFKMYGNS